MVIHLFNFVYGNTLEKFDIFSEGNVGVKSGRPGPKSEFRAERPFLLIIKNDNVQLFAAHLRKPTGH